MPITLSILHEEKLVLVHVEGELQPEEGRDAIAGLIASGALPYRKLIDLTFAPMTIGLAGIRAMAAQSTASGRDAQRGPIAIVMSSELGMEMVEMFERQVAFDRPLKVFRDTATARRWLDELAEPPAQT